MPVSAKCRVTSLSFLFVLCLALGLRTPDSARALALPLPLGVRPRASRPDAGPGDAPLVSARHRTSRVHIVHVVDTLVHVQRAETLQEYRTRTGVSRRKRSTLPTLGTVLYKNYKRELRVGKESAPHSHIQIVTSAVVQAVQRATATILLRAEVKPVTCAQLSEAGS